MVRNKALVYKRVPHGMPVPGQDLTVVVGSFNLKRPPPLGGLIVKTLYASLDPYQRACMGDPGLFPLMYPLALGKPLASLSIAKVLKSNVPKFMPGDIIMGLLAIQEYSIVNEGYTGFYAPIVNPFDMEMPVFLGVLGITGLTALGSVVESSRETKDEAETIFISSAAGGVGHLVGQLSKEMGLKVIGSVGTDEKLEFILNELEFDGGFNYKKENPLDALRRLAPGGIDIYHDNVGGEQLDAALESMNQFGLILCCGMISDYAKLPHERYRVKNLINVATRELTIKGFSVTDFFKEIYDREYPATTDTFAYRMKQGLFHTRSHVIDGIDNGPEGFVAMLRGENIGKTVLKIADE
ncbi:hypothetical protein K3495_g12206 [Podosphaera aphanis]|nr:hypothetical protein K3495_g12206 [Podosphaera aphanis]